MGVEYPSEPINRHEQYLAKIAGQAVEIPAEPITREEAYLDYIAKHGGGGGGGTNDYEELLNLPKINDVTLKGNKSLSDLGIASASALANKVDKVAGKDLSSNDYSDTEKQKNADNATAISAIKDGQSINSFADVETALSNKQDTLTFDDVPTENSNNPVKSSGVKSAIDAAVASAYHHAGTKTCAELIAGLLVAANEGNVYNMTDSGTTTADFIEGEGHPIKEGDNVGVAKISDGVYKFDLLSGFVDTSNFVQKSSTAGLIKNDGTIDTVEKQPATDNTLQTTDKTVAGAINEHEGDISALESGFTTLSEEINGDATTYPYADVITIEDAVPANLADCKVKVEPVQDLHGQSKPYVGGAWKNLLPVTLDNLKVRNTGGTWTDNVYNRNDATFTVNVDNGGNVASIKVNGTPNQDTTFVLALNVDLTVGTSYILSGCPIGGNTSTYFMQYSNYADTAYNDTGAGVTYSEFSHTYETRVFLITIKSGYNANNLAFYPMIRLATETDATFAPYTNICPITGHTEEKMTRDGFNIWDGTATDGKGVGNGGALYNDATLFATGYVRVFPNVTYYLNGENWKNWVWVFDGSKTALQEVRVDTTNRSIVFPSGTVYARFTGILSSKSTACINVFDAILNGNYEPYKGKTYTILFKDAQGQTITVYGSEFNPTTGVMKVDRVKFTPTVTTDIGKNTSEWPTNQFVVYPGVTAKESGYVISDRFETISGGSDIGVFISSRGNIRVNTNNYYQSVSDALAGEFASSEFCFELATPITIQLTPEQIQLLQGTNTLYASTGDISVTVNGVSGAIGAVQKQVNEIAEEVAEIKPVDYSTTEQKTGQKWIDGKDIYCRVFTGLSITTNTSWQDTGIDISNVDTIINGFATDDSKQSIVCSFGFGTNASLIFRTYISTNVITSITLYYTKTT